MISGTDWTMDHGLQVTIAVLGTSATKIFLVLEPFSKLDNRTVAAPWESALLSSLPALFFERYIFFERYNLKRRIPEQHAKNHVTSTFLGGAFCSDASVSAKPGMAPCTASSLCVDIRELSLDSNSHPCAPHCFLKPSARITTPPTNYFYEALLQTTANAPWLLKGSVPPRMVLRGTYARYPYKATKHIPSFAKVLQHKFKR